MADQPTQQPNRGFFREHPIGAIVLFLLLAGGAFGGYEFWKRAQTVESTDDAFVDGHTNYVSARITGNISAVYVQENQFVKAGDVIADIDPADYEVALERARADIAQAQAQISTQRPAVPMTATTNQSSVSSAQSDIQGAEAGVAAAERDREALQARLAEAKANSAKADAELGRYKMLVDKEEVSRLEYDQKVAASQAAAAEVRAISAQIESAGKIIEQRRSAVTQIGIRLQEVRSTAPQQLEMRKGAVLSAEAQAQAARAQIDQAELNLKYTKILAPVSGIIGKKALEVGMRVQPGQQLLVIIPLDDVWVTANFKENQIRKMRPNQPVKIHVDAYDKDYEGYVESLPAATGSKFSILPPENATGNYVKVVQRLPVRIRFNKDQDPEKRLRPGMSVVPTVTLTTG